MTARPACPRCVTGFVYIDRADADGNAHRCLNCSWSEYIDRDGVALVPLAITPASHPPRHNNPRRVEDRDEAP